MRALAVLAVVLCHAGVPGFVGGYVGVDLFFVISGYLICGNLARELAAGEFSLIGFYERRVRRILPPLFLVILACFAAGWWVLPPPSFESFARSAIPAALFFSNVHFRETTADYFAPAAEFEPLLHTWSLSVEEQFYLLVPLAMWLAWRIDRRLLLPGVVLATLASFGWSVRMVELTPTGAFFLIQSRAWELGVGAVLALGLLPLQAPRWAAELAASAGLLAIGWAVVTYHEATAFPGMAALPPVLGGAALIWAGERHSTAVSRVLSLAPMVWIGVISYALYLWHWPALVVARQLFASASIPFTATVIALLTALMLAWASTRLVEQPLRRRGPDALIARRPLFVLAAVLAVGIAVLSMTAIRNEGFWSRAPGVRERVAEAMQRSSLDEACRVSWREHGRLCSFGAASRQPAVLLWGDSHAGALLPGLAVTLSERGLGGVATVATGCPPLPGFRREQHGDDLDCSAINAAALDWLDANPDAVRTVILHASWTSHFTQTNGSADPKPRDALIDVATDRAVPREEAPQVLEAVLAGLVDRLSASGRRVILVGAVPQMSVDVPRAYLADSMAGFVPVTGRPVGDVTARETLSLAILGRIAQRDGVTLLDPIELICGETCPIEADGHLLYRDTNHMSQYASERFVPLMLEGVDL